MTPLEFEKNRTQRSKCLIKQFILEKETHHD